MFVNYFCTSLSDIYPKPNIEGIFTADNNYSHYFVASPTTKWEMPSQHFSNISGAQCNWVPVPIPSADCSLEINCLLAHGLEFHKNYAFMFFWILWKTVDSAKWRDAAFWYASWTEAKCRPVAQLDIVH